LRFKIQNKEIYISTLITPLVAFSFQTKTKFPDENQIKEAFINGGRGHPPSHLKFFLLVFSKLKEDIK